MKPTKSISIVRKVRGANMRRTLLGSCQNCRHDKTDYHDCNDCGSHSNNITCKGCSMFTKPRVMGSSKDGIPKPKWQTTTCRCLQNATKLELETKTCKYKEEI